MLARSLIDGQREIDRMKKEIEQIVTMAVGFFHNWNEEIENEAIALDSNEENLCSIGEFDEITWTIERDRERLIIRCNHSLFGTRYSYDERNSSFRGISNVKQIHNSLDAFVGAMVARFPWLAILWEPILLAAPPAV